MRELWRPVLQSATAGTINRVLALAIRFVTIPLLVRYLGNERYGMWMTIASTTAYITLLDFGVVSALVNKLTTHFQRGRTARANAYIIATSVLLLMVSVVGAAVAVLLVGRLDLAHVFRLTSLAAIQEVRATARVTIVFAALQLSSSPLLRVPFTMQRGYISEAYSAIGNILTLVGIIAVVTAGLGLPFLAAALMSAPVLAACGVGLHLYVERTLQIQWIGRRRWRAAMAVLRRSASDYVVMQVCATLLSTLQFFLLAAYQGAEAVTPYALLSQALIALQIPLAVLQQPLWTRLAALYDTGQVAQIRRVFVQYLWIALVYGLLAAVVIVFLSNPVLELVLKKQVVLDLPLRIGFALLCGLGLIAGGNLGSLLFAMRLSRSNAVLSITQLGLFLTFACILTPRFGAAGMVSTVLLTYLVAIPMLVRTLTRSLSPTRSVPASFRRNPATLAAR